MTRADLRALLRRRLNETTADNWTEPDLDGLLLEALRRLETIILRVEPQAFLTFCDTDLVQNQSFYDKPAGMLYEVRVETKTDANSALSKIQRGDLDDVMDDASAQSSGTNRPTMRYAHYGDELFLGPAPAQNVSGGLRVHYVPALSMAVDTDVPGIVLPLHLGIVLFAHLYAIGETGEGRDGILADLKEVLADVPLYYRKTGAEPETLQPQIEKGY